MTKADNEMTLTEAKTVNYQRLGELLALHYGLGQIMVACDVSPQTARQIMAGSGSEKPMINIAAGMVELAKAKNLEIPTNV